jgi:hypothetical protein
MLLHGFEVLDILARYMTYESQLCAVLQLKMEILE